MSYRLNIRAVTIYRILVCAAAIILLSVLQTSLFATFAPFGVTPDLLLAATVAVAICISAETAGVFGLCAGFVIDAIAGTGLALFPLFYMLVGYTCGVFSGRRQGTGLLPFIIFMLLAGVAKAGVGMIYSCVNLPGIPFYDMLFKIAVPEYFGTLLLSPLVYLLMLWLSSLPRGGGRA